MNNVMKFLHKAAMTVSTSQIIHFWVIGDELSLWRKNARCFCFLSHKLCPLFALKIFVITNFYLNKQHSPFSF